VSADPLRKRTAFVAADNLIQNQDHQINASDEEVVSFIFRVAHPIEQGLKPFSLPQYSRFLTLER
jgi:prophage maintenance system killer protein